MSDSAFDSLLNNSLMVYALVNGDDGAGGSTTAYIYTETIPARAVMNSEELSRTVGGAPVSEGFTAFVHFHTLVEAGDRVELDGVMFDVVGVTAPAGTTHHKELRMRRVV